MTRTLFLNFLFLTSAPFLRAQCPEQDTVLPNITRVVLRAVVTEQAGTGVFTYRYTIINPASSIGCVQSLEIDLRYPRNAALLSDTGLIDYPNYVDRSRPWGSDTSRTIPVGVPRLPNYKGFTSAWDAWFTRHGRIEWFRAIDIYGIEPGAQLDSILMTSHGLPGIKAAILSPGFRPVPIDTVESGEEEAEAEQASFDSLEATLQWRGLTVGPTAPPVNLISFDFLDTLSTYVTRSHSLGWITTDSTAAKYSGLFAQTRTDFRRGDLKSVTKTLDTIVQQLAIDSSSTISSEAYALLRFNTEYLSTQLRHNDKH